MHIFHGPSSSNWPEIYQIPLHQMCLTYSRMHIYLGQIYPTPIDHTCKEYHYTTEVSHIAECTYPRPPNSNWPEIYEILLHQICVTYSRMHIYVGQMYPPIDHKYMEYHYTTEVLHIAEYTYTKDPSSYWPENYGIPLHQISFTYSRKHIYLGQMYPLQLTRDIWSTTIPNKCHM